ncbi:MAG: hypothetical protein J6W24_07475 [Prevotella sp.]|nr:hypothetical protein [Prevotella sp.]
MDKTTNSLTRFINKIAEKFPPREDGTYSFTDIHVRVSQDTGDVMAFDDDDKEITRVIVEEWINAPLETDEFYAMVHKAFSPVIEQHGIYLNIAKPYNYVLENESGQYISELYIVDDSETTILGTPFMENLSAELDDFIENLLKE